MKLLRGNPGRRPINHEEPQPPPVRANSALAKCPKWLTGEARALWNRVAPGAITSGLLTVVDLPAFEAMCQSYARWREFERLSGKDLELAIAKGYRSAAVKERQLMLQFGARFGFDPSSRSNVKVRGSIVSTPAGGVGQKTAPVPVSRVDRFRQAKIGGAEGA